MMKESGEFSRLHLKQVYKQSPKRKLGRDIFRINSESAHLLGRAFVCEKIMKQNKADPYPSVDVLIGDLEIERASTINNYRKIAKVYEMNEVYVEDFASEEVV